MIAAGRPGTRAARLALVLAAVLGLVGCSGDDAGGVDTAPVALDDVTEVVEAPAVVTAKATATLTAGSDGRIAELFVTDGQAVQAGTVLLRLDSPQAVADLQAAQEADAQAAASADVAIPGIPASRTAAELERQAQETFADARAAADLIPDPTARAQAQAALAGAQAQYAAARSDAERAVRQLNAGLGSLADALSTLGAAQRVQTQAALDVAQRRVDALTITTPVGGVVTLGAAGGGSGGGTGLDLSQLPSSLADAAGALGDAAGTAGGGGGTGGATGSVGPLAVGSPVATGQALAVVTDVSTLSLAAEVDETDVLLVQPGTPGTAELDALPGAAYDVVVDSVDVSPTTSAGGGVTYRVRLGLGPGTDAEGAPAPAPRPGMSAVVGLRVREATDAVVVPAAAVVRDGSRDSVWVVEDGVVRRRLVTLGAQGEAEVAVASGLQAGETIVVRGADRVRDGQDLESG